ncbi:Amino acid deaminase OS=Streptomyces microflavus OX=1919 GN=Smic_52980 PE=3 SV=1 [Streptomyces microflavus]
MAADHPTGHTASHPANRPASLAAGLAEERVDHRFKALPPDAEGLTVATLTAERNLFTGGLRPPSSPSPPSRSSTTSPCWRRTPSATASRSPARQDLDGPAALRGPAEARCLGHHGRRAAPGAGLPGVRDRADLLANELVDAVALRWVAGEMTADPEFRFICTWIPCAGSS